MHIYFHEEVEYIIMIDTFKQAGRQLSDSLTQRTKFVGLLLTNISKLVHLRLDLQIPVRSLTWLRTFRVILKEYILKSLICFLSSVATSSIRPLAIPLIVWRVTTLKFMLNIMLTPTAA